MTYEEGRVTSSIFGGTSNTPSYLFGGTTVIRSNVIEINDTTTIKPVQCKVCETFIYKCKKCETQFNEFSDICCVRKEEWWSSRCFHYCRDCKVYIEEDLNSVMDMNIQDNSNNRDEDDNNEDYTEE